MPLSSRIKKEEEEERAGKNSRRDPAGRKEGMCAMLPFCRHPPTTWRHVTCLYCMGFILIPSVSILPFCLEGRLWHMPSLPYLFPCIAYILPVFCSYHPPGSCFLPSLLTYHHYVSYFVRSPFPPLLCCCVPDQWSDNHQATAGVRTLGICTRCLLYLPQPLLSPPFPACSPTSLYHYTPCRRISLSRVSLLPHGAALFLVVWAGRKGRKLDSSAFLLSSSIVPAAGVVVVGVCARAA